MNNEFLRQAAELALRGSSAWHSKEVLETSNRLIGNIEAKIIDDSAEQAGVNHLIEAYKDINRNNKS